MESQLRLADVCGQGSSMSMQCLANGYEKDTQQTKKKPENSHTETLINIFMWVASLEHLPYGTVKWMMGT